jgi:hypothetical protein
MQRVAGSETPLTNFPESVRFTLKCPACGYSKFSRT